MSDYASLWDLLDKYKAELPGKNDQEKKDYINDIRTKLESLPKLSQRSDEDRRLGCQIAVDTSTALVQIAIAVIVAIGGFITYAIDHHWNGWSIGFLVLAALFSLASMISGFTFVSCIYKRGEGRDNPNGIPWSTEALKGFINFQAYFGIVSLLSFATAIFLSYERSSALDAFICL